VPFDRSEIVPGNVVEAQHLDQLFEALTGEMTDQPITLAEKLILANLFGLDIAIQGSAPAAPGAGKTRLYPKAGGWYYREGAAGAETPMVTPPAGSITPAMFTLTGAVAANTVLRGLSGTTMGFGQIVPGDFTPGTTTVVKMGGAVLSGAASSIDISSIPQTYQHIEILISARTDRAATDDLPTLRFNNDSAANYDYNEIAAISTSDTVTSVAAQTSGRWGFIVGNTATADNFSAARITIPNYAMTNQRKSWISWSSIIKTTGTSSTYGQNLFAGMWRSTAAINRITLLPGTGPNFLAGTVVSIYGIPA
jgi:hypothetical protein